MNDKSEGWETWYEVDGEKVHPWYGPCDAFLPDGGCAECQALFFDRHYGLTERQDRWARDDEQRARKKARKAARRGAAVGLAAVLLVAALPGSAEAQWRRYGPYPGYGYGYHHHSHSSPWPRVTLGLGVLGAATAILAPPQQYPAPYPVYASPMPPVYLSPTTGIPYTQVPPPVYVTPYGYRPW